MTMQTEPTPAPRRGSRRRLLRPVLFTLSAGAVLLGLGFWQLQRLAAKETLIAAIASRADATPVPLPPRTQWLALDPETYDYRHVETVGHFDHDKEALVFRGFGPHGQGPGYLVLTPLRLDDGGYVIVNRGYVDLVHKDPMLRATGQIAGEIRLKGLMRPPEQRNFFTPADDPGKGAYFTRDPALIAAHFGLGQAAPFSIDADAGDVPGGWPQGGATVRDLPNNHLAYAITWFGLAGTLILVFAAFVLRGRRVEPS
jgi:surfeit locus 1 family protein